VIPAGSLAGWAQAGLALFAGGGVWLGAGAEERVVVPVEHLTLTLPALEGLAPSGENRWHGTLGASRVEIRFQVLSSGKYRPQEPEDVLEVGPSFWSSPGTERNDPTQRRAREGPYGFASYAAWERTELAGREGGASTLRYLIAGLLPDTGYWITVEAAPPPADEGALRAFLETGIVWSGPVREHRWTEAEARARFERDAPAATHAKFEAPVRTAHYIVLGNSKGGEAFGRKMEECFRTIRATYPFDEVPGRRLLPVFLFRTSAEYFEFYATIAGIDLERAERSKGHAWRDYYATWYEAPGDPVHVHEATHQIFATRLGLGGGGSWFQEGVAEYLSSKPGERSAAAGRVKRGQHVPLEEFVLIPSLLQSSDPGALRGPEAGEHYSQAALLIECLRESKWAKPEFQRFLAHMGRAGRSLAAIEHAFEAVYGFGIGGIEERFVEYCKQR
jgi:hypothetical protein